jgi:hypothetical protein
VTSDTIWMGDSFLVNKLIWNKGWQCVCSIFANQFFSNMTWTLTWWFSQSCTLHHSFWSTLIHTDKLDCSPNSFSIKPSWDSICKSSHVGWLYSNQRDLIIVLQPLYTYLNGLIRCFSLKPNCEEHFITIALTIKIGSHCCATKAPQSRRLPTS